MDIEHFAVYVATTSWQVYIFTGFAAIKCNDYLSWGEDDLALAAFLNCKNHSGQIH